LRSEELYASEIPHATRKDIATNYPKLAGARPDAPAASVVAFAHSETLDPAPDVTPSGTPHYKNAGQNTHDEWQRRHSSPAERTSARQKIHPTTLGAYPRAPRQRQLAPVRKVRPAAVPVAVVDTPGFAAGVAVAPPRWPENAD
jgi:hypothetical protein